MAHKISDSKTSSLATKVDSVFLDTEPIPLLCSELECAGARVNEELQADIFLLAPSYLNLQ